MNNLSLHTQYPKLRYIAVCLGLSFIFLILGLFLPAIYLKEMAVFRSTFSVLTGIENLFVEKHYILGLVIIVFSIIFPICKLFILCFIWFGRIADSKKSFLIHWLDILGKWSMLDVFVVAITVVITQISKFADAGPKIGIYFFCISVLITMLITERIGKIIKQESK